MGFAVLIQNFVLVLCLLFTSILNQSVAEFSMKNLNSIADVNPLDEFKDYDVANLELFVNNHRITGTLTANGHYAKLVLVVAAFDKVFVLDLKLNRYLFTTSYIEKAATNRGDVYYKVNLTEGLCYYTGCVRGVPLSTAAISTCNQGVVGHFVIGDESYHIQPVNATLSSKHNIFKESDSLRSKKHCGHNESTSEHQHLHRGKRSNVFPESASLNPKIVELYMVITHAEYLFYGSDTTTVSGRTKDIVNIMSSIYELLGIYIALVGIEIWTDGERIDYNTTATYSLENFLAYRQTNINPLHDNDNAMMITTVEFDGGVVGKAPVMSMCSFMNSGGVNSDVSLQPGYIGTTMAHEMGHNFGLLHDTQITPCYCSNPSGRCIMYPSSSGPNAVWSVCSLQQFNVSFAQGMDSCLYNVPVTILNSVVCGNGLLDDREQCDCGSSTTDACNPSCCNPQTCQLVGHATCASGRCCNLNTCQFKRQATECRSITGNCDLGEYCNGTSALCPQDTYLHDGSSCTVDGVSSFCYHGTCCSSQSQCQLLYGSGSNNSAKVCYTNVNTRGDIYGSCAHNWTNMSYKPCSSQDVYCGTLHCFGGDLSQGYYQNNNLYIIDEITYTIGLQKFPCKTAIYDFGLEVQDPGFVPNGASCGIAMMCLSQKCVAISSVLGNLPCSNCNSHGVCNNLGHCHCDAGYAPTDCSQSGLGGSIDSGPMTNDNFTTDMYFLDASLNRSVQTVHKREFE